MADRSAKILVCSGVNGRINGFIDYLESMFTESGDYDYVFCIGNFFGDEENSENEWKQFLDSGKTVSVPVYILGPNKTEHKKYFQNLTNKQLAPNIYYLGKQGIITSSEGLTIGFISGIQGPFQGIKCEMHEFNCESLEMFKKCFVRSEKKLDILLTSPWPTDVYNNDNTNNISFSKENLDTKCVSNLLSWIAINVTPNYHFSGMQGIYYERTPYKSPNNQITRFIALGNYYNINEPETNPKPKWFYDFILKKKKLIAPKDTIVTTNSPYSATFEYCVQPISKEYFTKISASDRALRIQKFKERSNQTSEGKTDVCLLCWSNQTSANKHMIVSTGDLVYLAGSKSPLVQENLFISTIGHYKSFNRISKIGQFEVNMFKLSLIKYFQSSGRQVVFFEQNIMSTHFNLQAIPVPVSNNMIDRIKCAFIAKFKEHGLNLEPIYEKALLYKMITSEGYFYLELPERKYYLYTTYNKDNTEFPSLIAREVLASKSLLDIEDRIDEKNCTKDISEETKDIETFKVAFKVFNKFKEVEKE